MHICFPALLAAMIVFTPTSGLAQKTRVDVGDEAPAFTARTLNPERSKTKVFSLDSAVGAEAIEKRKAVLVYFAQARCQPCLDNLRFLKALYGEFRDNGKGLLVISVVFDKDEVELKKFSDALDAAEVDFPALNDRFSIVAKRYFTAEPPSFFIIDEAGRVAKAAQGASATLNADIVAEVRKSLGLPVSDPVPAALASFVNRGAPATPAPSAQASPEAPTDGEDDDTPKKGKKGAKGLAAKKPKPTPVKGKKKGRKEPE